MTATTGAPGFIEYYTNSDLDPIPDGFASLASSVNASLGGLITEQRQLRSYRWASAVQRNAQTGMQPGDIGYQTDVRGRFTYYPDGWTQDPAFLGDAHSTAQVETPATTAIVPVAGAAVSFNLSGSSNVRVVSTLLLNAGSLPARAQVLACAVKGTTPTMTGALISTVFFQATLTTAGSAGRVSGTVEQTFQLTPGQWTVFPGVRSAAGSIITALERNYCSAYIV